MVVGGASTAWAQSDFSALYTSNVTLPSSGTGTVSSCIVNVNTTQYNGTKLGKNGAGASATFQAPAGTKYIHLHVAAWNGQSTGFTYKVGDGTAQSISGITSNSGIKGNPPFTFDGDASSSNYYKVITLDNPLASDTDITFSSTSERAVFWGVNTESVATPSYVITAQSNNNSYGTVALEGSFITATPADGYRVSTSEPYTVSPANSATVSQSGNVFTVTPSENTTVTINFEAIPTHTVTFSVNGDVSRKVSVAEGGAIVFPTAKDTPADETEFNKTISGKTFVGWYTDEYSDASVAPSYVNTSTATMSTSDITYYAVYADVEEEESDDVAHAKLDQTLQYDTWTYSGSTTDKSGYRLFHTDSYIESEAFDLSTLKKVIIYAGTYGGPSYNSLTIGDGTNTWKDVTVSGSSQTGVNEFVDGTALSGTKALRITSNSGTDSGNGTGVRISKVEIFVKGSIRTESDYTTSVRMDAGISFADAEVNVKLTSGYAGQELTNPNAVTVAYSSSDETVATVNSSTGALSMLKAGTTTITASFAGDANYLPAEVSYELIVTEKNPHDLAYAVTEIEKLTTDAVFTNALTNEHSLAVTYTSSVTSVATVNATTGEVTVTGAGTTVITATFAGDKSYEEGEASYTLTVSKDVPTLSFASENAIGREGEAFEGNELTNPAGLTVSYESSDETVATVDENTGAVTIVAAGTTTITATFAGNDTYVPGETSYTLKVLATPTITVADDAIEFGEIFNIDDSSITGGPITVTSDNANIVAIDGLVITPIACGSVEITVSTAEDETYKAGSETFTLTVTAPEGKTAAPSGDVVLFGESFGNNTGSARDWNDSYSVKSGVLAVYSGITGYTVSNAKQGKNSTGSTQSGLNQSTSGSDASIILGPLNVEGYSDMTLSYQWKAASVKGTYTTSAYYATSSEGEFTEMEGSGDGATTFVERSYTIPEAAQVSSLYLKIVWNTSNTQGIIDEVRLTIPEKSSATVTLNKNGLATYCSQYPMDFSSAQGYTAWRVTGVSNEGVVSLEKITEAIKGGQGVLLYNKNADGVNTSEVTVNFADGATEYSDAQNKFFGTTAPTYVDNEEYLGLSGNKFVKVNAGTIPAGKALLPVSVLPAGARQLTFQFEDDGQTTGISDQITVNGEKSVYDLQGRKVEKTTKGLYIVNGRKVVVK
ncbi:InlB B-repeat-containing protein [Prevotella sp. E9-3]|uniref:InlB B-repeat-containing protein n=1 Tax=Prevotella sp. E9-3 TaxID=2913621 RepID=UPI001EDC242F|nr:InlB B-repeat-containing protein [Prevotella sp. E9-3]UKK49215.1 InlB B-repeat-containing protein [Prevotella sp. E9-3]